ncbi:MAG: hypothetical protein JO163_01875 [Methylobacteriaceae bacterium]|nr:hypothetical protein [Methylobacteriaceae bacterium]
MSILQSIARELYGLFVDDGSLALAILVLMGAIAVLRVTLPLSPDVIGPAIFIGCAAILVENVLRRARRR